MTSISSSLHRTVGLPYRTPQLVLDPRSLHAQRHCNFPWLGINLFNIEQTSSCLPIECARDRTPSTFEDYPDHPDTTTTMTTASHTHQRGYVTTLLLTFSVTLDFLIICRSSTPMTPRFALHWALVSVGIGSTDWLDEDTDDCYVDAGSSPHLSPGEAALFQEDFAVQNLALTYR